VSHTHTNVICHFIFATKHRAPTIPPEHRSRIHEYLGGTLRGLGALPLITNGIDDHVHLLAKLNRNRTLSDLMRDLKANSSRWIRSTFSDNPRFAWQRGYGAFSVSESQVARVRSYIERQEEHHRHMTFAEEFEAMLRANGIEFDRAYLFD
jgi:putative transposase